MIASRSRYFVFALAVLLVLPAFVQSASLELAWWSADDGTVKTIDFTIPNQGSCRESELTCWIGDTKLETCGALKLSTEVDYVVAGSSTPAYFQAKALPEARVRCFNADKSPYVGSDLNASGITCTLADSKFETKKWETVFIPYDKITPNKKAEPWNGTQSYCPDPLLYSEAYDRATGGATDGPTSETVRRKLLETCAVVVGRYESACGDALGAATGELTKIEGAKRDFIEEKKRLFIVEWLDDSLGCKTAIGAEGKIALKGACLDQWNLIKGYSATDFAIKEDGNFADESKLTKIISLGLKTKIKAQMNTALGKKWQSRSLDAFLSAEAETKWSEAEAESYEAKTAEPKAKIKNLKEMVLFLQKLSMDIRLSNAISGTRTFPVTDLLRRKKSSIESELTLFDKEAKDPKGNSLNIFDKVIRLVAQVLGSLGVLLLIVSAVMMILSQGEETMLQKSKQTFIYTLVGLLVAFFSYTIVRFVLELLLLR